MDSNFQKFENLIKKDKYQVFVLSCPAYFPVNFARHPWFAVNKKGIISRYEVRNYKIKNDHKYLHINTQPPFRGINITFFVKKHFWRSTLLGCIEGDENSTAKRAIDFIESSKENYPYVYKYSLIGPNSNTYLEWVLNAFPELNIKTSWRFIGKDFK